MRRRRPLVLSVSSVSSVSSVFSAFSVWMLVACGSSGDSSGAPGQDTGAGGPKHSDGGGDTRADDAGARADAVGDSTPSGSANGAPPACVGAGGGGSAPDPRGDTAGALDPGGTKLLVFGGDIAVPLCGKPPPRRHTGDTWLLDVGCGRWKSVAGDGSADGIGPRARHVLVSDPAGRHALLFGGRTRAGSSGPYTLFNDVWSFDFNAETWSLVEASGSAPAPRANTAAVLDPSAKQLVVFGGNVDTAALTFKPTDDTWALDLETKAWRPITAKGAPNGERPPKRLFHAMTIDPTTRTAYVFGGGDERAFTGPFFADVWALDLAAGTWREVKTTGEPPAARIHAGLMFDPVGQRLVVFGGHDDGRLGNRNDVTALDLTTSPATWRSLSGGDTFKSPPTGACNFPADFTAIDARSPERREAFAFAPRADGRAFVIYGGKSDCGLLADAWWWGAGAATWTAMVKVPTGLSCLRYSTTCTGLCG